MHDFIFLPLLTLLDVIALIVFAFSYYGYSWVVSHPPRDKVYLRGAMDIWRYRWMNSLAQRDVRIMDTQLIGHIMHSVTFFASTSILLLAGLAAAFGASERASEALSDLPFVFSMTADQFAIKLFLPMALVIHAFFVLTFGLRQFNYACVVIGSLANGPDESEREIFVRTASDILGLATKSFNKGLRGYYFALAAMGWFLHPMALIGFTIGVVILLSHRQIKSAALQALIQHKKV